MAINSEETIFWRYHKRRPVHYLSTIEAIYYFLVQLHQTMFQLKQTNFGLNENNLKVKTLSSEFDESYQNQYDNLLFFFKHTYYLIKDRYQL